MDMEEIMALESHARYTVMLKVRVDDPELLFNAAVAKRRDVDVQTAREDFQYDDGSINVEACLQYVYEPDDSAPGTELEETDCEED